MTTILLVVILIVVVINHIAVRAMQNEVKSIKGVSKINDEGDVSTSDLRDTLSNMHDSLLSEIQRVDEKVEDIQDKLSPPKDEMSEDQLYEEAKRVVMESDKCSTSLLQRRLKVGYSRAARLVDMLEENGLVGPANGAEPRKVLINK